MRLYRDEAKTWDAVTSPEDVSFPPQSLGVYRFTSTVSDGRGRCTLYQGASCDPVTHMFEQYSVLGLL